MRCVSVEGKVVTIEKGFWIFKWQEKYEASKKIVGDFYSWVRLPNRILVHDRLGFQLDEFYRSSGK